MIANEQNINVGFSNRTQRAFDNGRWRAVSSHRINRDDGTTAHTDEALLDVYRGATAIKAAVTAHCVREARGTTVRAERMRWQRDRHIG